MEGQRLPGRPAGHALGGHWDLKRTWKDAPLIRLYDRDDNWVVGIPADFVHRLSSRAVLDGSGLNAEELVRANRNLQGGRLLEPKAIVLWIADANG
jgi:hypothetical protein